MMLVYGGRELILPQPGFTSSTINGLIDFRRPDTRDAFVGASTTLRPILITLLPSLATCLGSVDEAADQEESLLTL